MSASELPHLHEHVLGAGAPMVLLHAAASSGAQWRAVMVRLSRHAHLIAPDLYGEGESMSAPNGFGVIDADLAALEARLARVEAPVVLVGHSYGAVLALELALRLPERIRRLVLIEPVAFHLLRERTAGRTQIELEAVRAGIEEAVARGALRDAATQFVRYWSGQGTWTQLPEATRLGLERSMPKVARGWGEICALEHTLSSYAHLSIPTLILVGEKSRAPMVWICHALAQRIIAAELHTILGASHMSPMTHPELVTNRILGFCALEGPTHPYLTEPDRHRKVGPSGVAERTGAP